MACFRILFATTAGIGCLCGPWMNQCRKQTFHVKAQVSDPEKAPGSEHYQNPHLCSRFAKYGLPQRDVILRYKHFQMSYDQRNLLPNWVLEHFTREKLALPKDGITCRRDFSFHLEPRIKKEFQSDAVDFETVMLRVNLADFSNYRNSTKGVFECHSRTNGAPQNLQFQSGMWRDVEIYCRYLTQVYDDVYVFSGPVFEPTSPDRMQYQVSQTHNLAFPNYYYKIIIGRNCSGFHLGCYLFPNAQIGQCEKLSDFRVALSDIEKKAGFKVFKDGVNIPETLVNVLDFRERRHVYMPDELPGVIDFPIADYLDAGGHEQNGREPNAEQHI